MAKKRKINVKNLLIVCAVALLVLILAVLGIKTLTGGNEKKEAASVASAEPAETAETTPEPTPEPTVDPESDPRFTDTDSLLVIANKKHRLPDGYEPADLRAVNVISNVGTVQMRDEAATAVETMFASAANDGITLVAQTAYRGEAFQAQLYNGYVAQYDVERADTISSRPGYSDHQTGLAMDIADHDSATVFTSAMENTPEGQWLYQHAHEYGFVLRYPKGKDEYTGYTFEPWHFRYIGVENATEVWNADPDMTLEEYYGISGGDYAE